MNNYNERLEKIEEALKFWLPEKADPVWAEKVFSGIGGKVKIESINAMIEPLKDILSRGGKRWRPLLMTLICETLGGGDAAIPLSPLVEFPHNASLVHDDIEDDSDERRGKPAVHKIYGVDTAINSGSFFYFLSSCCIDAAAGNKDIILKLWTESLRKLHLGQSMDINWHRSSSYFPGIEEYYLMCTMKTGSLARLAAELGAYTAGATPEKARELGETAEKIGIGFQILDDVKNLTTGIPGKKRGDDIVEGKKSLPILLYLHKYPENQKKIFYYLYAAKQDGIAAPEVEELINALAQGGVLKEAEEKGRSLINEAREAFGSDALLDGFFSLIS